MSSRNNIRGETPRTPTLSHRNGEKCGIKKYATIAPFYWLPLTFSRLLILVTPTM